MIFGEESKSSKNRVMGKYERHSIGVLPLLQLSQVSAQNKHIS